MTDHRGAPAPDGFGLYHDKIHKDSGVARGGKSVRVEAPAPTLGERLLDEAERALAARALAERADVSEGEADSQWAPDDPRRWFVAGAAWWEFEREGATMWGTDRYRAECEAVRRWEYRECRAERAEGEAAGWLIQQMIDGQWVTTSATVSRPLATFGFQRVVPLYRRAERAEGDLRARYDDLVIRWKQAQRNIETLRAQLFAESEKRRRAERAEGSEAGPEEYYYRESGCKAENRHSPDCICWHKVGTGPFPDARPGAQTIPGTWRPLYRRAERAEGSEATWHDRVQEAFNVIANAPTDADMETDLADVIAILEDRVSALRSILPIERAEPDGALSCVKCGSADIHTRYRAKGERLDVGNWREDATEECLRRYCRGCQYMWTDSVLASAPQRAGTEGEKGEGQ